MRKQAIAFLVVFFALSALPLAARFGRFGPDAKLRGSVAPPDEVALSAKTYWSGSFQKAFESNFESALGFRAALIRSDNELNLRAFKEFAPSPGTMMILGKHNFVYERDYVDAHNRRNLVALSELEDKVQLLKLLQDYLAKRGETLLVVISPSKADIYAEDIPSRFLVADRVGLRGNYDEFVSLTEKYGINVLDAQALAFDWRRAQQLPVFANSGAHWNDPLACGVTARINHFIARELKLASPALSCEPYVTHDAPRGPDRDLSALANLWHEETLFQPTLYASPRVRARKNPSRPSILFTGSSFLWQILDYENRFRLEQHDTFFYYYKARIDYPSGRRTPLHSARIDWQGDVFSRQAIVIEINASAVEHVGWGFLEDAARAIRGG